MNVNSEKITYSNIAHQEFLINKLKKTHSFNSNIFFLIPEWFLYLMNGCINRWITLQKKKMISQILSNWRFRSCSYFSVIIKWLLGCPYTFNRVLKAWSVMQKPLVTRKSSCNKNVIKTRLDLLETHFCKSHVKSRKYITWCRK